MFPYRRALYGDLESADVLLAILILAGLIVFIQLSSFIYRRIKKSKSVEDRITDLPLTEDTQSE